MITIYSMRNTHVYNVYMQDSRPRYNLSIDQTTQKRRSTNTNLFDEKVHIDLLTNHKFSHIFCQ